MCKNTIAEYFLLKTAVNHRKSQVFLTTQTTLYPIISKCGRALANHLLLVSQDKPGDPGRLYFSVI